MKRNTKKRRQPDRKRKKNSSAGTGAGDQKSAPVSRRDVLGTLRNWGLFGVAAAAGGWYLVDEVTATIAEHDLSRVGNGKPTVVQIHDPQCTSCLALQSETRKALKTLDRGALQYVVADIRTAKGERFAAAHRVGHVTLILFDQHGKRRGTLTGNRSSKSLASVFQSHVKRYGKR